MIRAPFIVFWKCAIVFASMVALAGQVLADDSVSGKDRAGSLVEEARVAAAADRHREAIAKYLAALRESDSLRDDISKEVGHQYTWAGYPDSAVYWYEVHLRYHPDDTDARVGLARALSHADRLDEALESYDAILDSDPGNLEARIGRAYVINWSGRHREAARHFASMLSDDPENTAARVGLARAYQWIGREDLALQTIADVDGDSGLSLIAAEIKRDRMPDAEYTYSSDEDSDDIERRGHSVSSGLSPRVLSRVRVSYANEKLTQPEHPDVEHDAIAFEWHQRFSGALALTIVPGYEWNAYDRFGPESFWNDEFNLFVFDAYATVTPTDWVRMDFGANRASLANPEPLYRAITVDTYSAGLDWRFTTRLLSVSAVSYSTYSDDNTRVMARQSLIWSTPFRAPLPGQNRITSTSAVDYLSFSEQLPNGYYNPDDYLTLYQVIGLESSPSPSYTIRVEGRLGLDSENGGALFTVGSIGGSLTVRPAAGLSVTAGLYNSRSRLDTRTGYQADGFYISTAYNFGH